MRLKWTHPCYETSCVNRRAKKASSMKAKVRQKRRYCRNRRRRPVTFARTTAPLYKVKQTIDSRKVSSMSKIRVTTSAMRGYKDAEPNIAGPTCGICHKAVQQPCWACLCCYTSGLYARDFCTFTPTQTIRASILSSCDNCEQDSLLRCICCQAFFEQPFWYYGYQPGTIISTHDNILCSTEFMSTNS